MNTTTTAKEQNYQITYFSNSEQRVVTKIFTGPEAFNQAVSWGEANLENFNADLINLVN